MQLDVDEVGENGDFGEETGSGEGFFTCNFLSGFVGVGVKCW